MNTNALIQHPSSLGGVYEGALLSRTYGGHGVAYPLAKLKQMPMVNEFGQPTNANDQDYVVAGAQTQEKPFVAPLIVKDPRFEVIDSAVIQVWEGKVLEVDSDNGVMQVLLNAKIGQVLPHTGEIELQWVSEQDLDLVCPGAIFYLTLFKRKKRGGIENAQELRFRRRPSWTRQQIVQIEHEANMLLSKMKARPLAE